MLAKRIYRCIMASVLLSCASGANMVSASEHSGCASVRQHVYSDGSRLLSENDTSLKTAGLKARNFLAEPVAPTGGLASGVAVVKNLKFMDAQGVAFQGDIVPKNGGSFPRVYRQSCSLVSVVTIDGPQKLPLFVTGGTVVLEETSGLTYINFGGFAGTLSKEECLTGELKVFSGRQVFVVGNILSDACTIRRGKIYFRASSPRPTLLTTKSARRLLASYRKPAVLAMPLDTALLIGDI
jgi:hypothetical protein